MNTRVISWGADERQVDRGILTGAILAFVLIVGGLLIGGHLLSALNPLSFLIVLGGTLAATLVHFSWYDITRAWEAFKKILFTKTYHPSERIAYLTEISQKIRHEGLLVLEREAEYADDPFLKMALQLTVDGQTPIDVKRILETEMRAANDRSMRGVSVFQTMGTYSPAFGLIGTILGMMQMLTALSDPASVGPAMATALTTTLYGAIFSNMVFLPIAGKLKNQIEEEILVKAITVEGVLSLGRQENTLILEQRLQGFLPLNAEQ